MPAVTPDQGLSLPVDADAADNPVAFTNFVAGAESRLVLRYADAADRTARHAVGVEGQYSDLAAEGWSDAFDGTSWVSAVARGYRAYKVRDGDSTAIVSSTVLVNDAILFAPLEATGRFVFGGALYYDSPAAADFKMAFTWPGAPATSRWGGMGRDPATLTNITTPLVTGSGATMVFGGNAGVAFNWLTYVGFIRNPGVAGNLQLQYAQSVSDPGGTLIFGGSHLWVMRIS